MMVSDEERRRVAAELRGWEFYYPENLDRYLCDVFGIPANANAFFTPDIANPEDTFIPNVLANYIEPSCDRDELLNLAKEMEEFSHTCDHYDWQISPMRLMKFACRIRNALGVVE